MIDQEFVDALLDQPSFACVKIEVVRFVKMLRIVTCPHIVNFGIVSGTSQTDYKHHSRCSYKLLLVDMACMKDEKGSLYP